MTRFGLLLLSLMVGEYCLLTHQDQYCEEGTYGRACHSKCHCKCFSNEKCREEYVCDSFWMGPECQHANILYNPEISVTDGDTESCSYVKKQTTVNMSLMSREFTPAFHFTWLMIVWEYKAVDIEFKGFYKGKEVKQKVPIKPFKVSKRIFNYHGEFERGIDWLTLKFKKLAGICEIKISKGRNVALNQDVSFVGKRMEEDSKAFFITDGSVAKDDGCWDGEHSKNTPSVTVKFNKTVSIWLYILVTRPETRNCGMRYFKIETMKDGSVVNSFEKKDPNAWFMKKSPYYHALTKSQTATKVKVSLPQRPGRDFGCLWADSTLYLTICELIAYGESICPRGKWGRHCDRDCKCEIDEDCYPSTGHCPSNCLGCGKESGSDPITSPFIGLVVANVVALFVVL